MYFAQPSFCIIQLCDRWEGIVLLNFILKGNQIGPSYSTWPFHQATYKFHAQIHVMGKFWCAAYWLECEWYFDICFCLCFGFGIELVIEWVVKSQLSILQILHIFPILDKIIHVPHYLLLLLWVKSKLLKFWYKISR